jgi:hypothetical protein
MMAVHSCRHFWDNGEIPASWSPSSSVDPVRISDLDFLKKPYKAKSQWMQ